jgi:hypothetical protein
MSELSDKSNITIAEGDLCKQAEIDLNDGESTFFSVYGRQLQVP